MGVSHTVKQGEHAARIASTYHFFDWRPVWSAPENAELRQKRSSPDVLMPGDTVYIPDRQDKELPAATEQLHVYKLLGKPLRLRVQVVDRFRDNVRNTPFVFDAGGDAQTMTTGGSGDLDRALPQTVWTAEDGALQFDEALTAQGQPVTRTLRIPLKIGYIDPVDEVSGQLKRLRNLGYYAPAGDEPDPKLFPAAIEEFQCENALMVDGVCGQQTQAKLKQVYGC